jgi:hypothetical protein
VSPSAQPMGALPDDIVDPRAGRIRSAYTVAGMAAEMQGSRRRDCRRLSAPQLAVLLHWPALRHTWATACPSYLLAFVELPPQDGLLVAASIAAWAPWRPREPGPRVNPSHLQQPQPLIPARILPCARRPEAKQPFPACAQSSVTAARFLCLLPRALLSRLRAAKALDSRRAGPATAGRGGF